MAAHCPHVTFEMGCVIFMTLLDRLREPLNHEPRFSSPLFYQPQCPQKRNCLKSLKQQGQQVRENTQGPSKWLSSSQKHLFILSALQKMGSSERDIPLSACLPRSLILIFPSLLPRSSLLLPPSYCRSHAIHPISSHPILLLHKQDSKERCKVQRLVHHFNQPSSTFSKLVRTRIFSPIPGCNRRLVTLHAYEGQTICCIIVIALVRTREREREHVSTRA